MSHLIGYALVGILIFSFGLYLLHLRKQLDAKGKAE